MVLKDLLYTKCSPLSSFSWEDFVHGYTAGLVGYIGGYLSQQFVLMVYNLILHLSNKQECIQHIVQRPIPTSPVHQKDPTIVWVEANLDNTVYFVHKWPPVYFNRVFWVLKWSSVLLSIRQQFSSILVLCQHLFKLGKTIKRP